MGSFAEESYEKIQESILRAAGCCISKLLSKPSPQTHNILCFRMWMSSLFSPWVVHVAHRTVHQSPGCYGAVWQYCLLSAPPRITACIVSQLQGYGTDSETGFSFSSISMPTGSIDTGIYSLRSYVISFCGRLELKINLSKIYSLYVCLA